MYGAEREGFEPSVQFPAQQFSRLPQSTALPPLRNGCRGWVRGVAKVKILGELLDSWVELSGLMGMDFWGDGGKCAGLEENR